MIKIRFSICIPTYNSEETIKDTIENILNQSFNKFEIIVCDDISSDRTREIIRSIDDSRISLYCFDENIGYPENLERCRKRSNNEIIFLMGQDDIIADGTLEKYHSIFKNNEDVGAITRTYYWFHDDIDKPVRAKRAIDRNKDFSIISVKDEYEKIEKVFKTLDQLSCLAFRQEYMDRGFHEDVFTSHVYPFASIFKKHDVAFINRYILGVRIGSSQTRHVSSIYSKSPMQSWVDLFQDVFAEDQFKNLRKSLIKNFVAKNYVGLIQIKNYGKLIWLLREIKMLVKYNSNNIINPKFWFFSIGTLVTPRRILIPMVDIFKEKVLSKTLSEIELEHLQGTK